MAELECCVPLLKCAEGQTTFGERRFGGGEECFCVDSRGLAQGVGVFRMRGVDLVTSYRDGARTVEGDHRLERVINSEGAGLVLVGLVIALSLLGGAREGLRALAASVATWVVVVPVACLGMLLAGFASPGWGSLSTSYAVGLAAGALAMFGWGWVVLALMRARVWRVVWVHVLISALASGLMAARSQDAVRAQELISHAPALVRGSDSGD
jgi:hypothetical protein